ncbi:MAG: ABC transporter ATP-binding protein [Lachnospiraceae bacterium]
MLQVKDLTVKYGGNEVVSGLDFHVEEGQWLMIVGPNGAGKSSVLKAITQSVPYDGLVTLHGNDVRKLKPIYRARKIGVMTQNHFVGYDFTVEEIVRLGRYAHSRGIFAGKRENDTMAVENALALTGLTEMRNKSVLTLSGGELQRTFLAQTFAQEPELLLLDEPTNHLDLVYQKQIFALISGWVKEKGHAVISVVHDLSLAKAFGSNALLLENGKRIAFGENNDVLSPRQLNPVYGMDVYEWMHTMLAQW